MSIINFLLICAATIGTLIALFFWLTEGGGSAKKQPERAKPLARPARNVTLNLATSNRTPEPEQPSQPSEKPQRSAPQEILKGLPKLDGHLKGSGDFDLPVVGESKYQHALREIAEQQGRGDDDGLVAYIVTEPDNPYDPNACAVYIGDKKVGYLPREDAVDYVERMEDNGIKGVSCFETRAKLIGGTDDKKFFGVILDLPIELRSSQPL